MRENRKWSIMAAKLNFPAKQGFFLKKKELCHPICKTPEQMPFEIKISHLDPEICGQIGNVSP